MNRQDDDDLRGLFDRSATPLDRAARARLDEVAAEADLRQTFEATAPRLDDLTRARLERAAAQSRPQRRWGLAAIAVAALILAAVALPERLKAPSQTPAVAAPTMPVTRARPALAQTAQASAAEDAVQQLSGSDPTAAALGLVALHGEEDLALDGLAMLDL